MTPEPALCLAVLDATSEGARTDGRLDRVNTLGFAYGAALAGFDPDAARVWIKTRYVAGDPLRRWGAKLRVATNSSRLNQGQGPSRVSDRP